METWDLYNENRELLGIDHIRGKELPEGCYHLVVHAWIRNSKGEYLISQRSADRPTFPLMWECVGGSVLKGEDSLSGAIREVQEEVGLILSPDTGKLIHSVIGRVFNGVKFNDIAVVVAAADNLLYLQSTMVRLRQDVPCTLFSTFCDLQSTMHKANDVFPFAQWSSAAPRA